MKKFLLISIILSTLFAVYSQSLFLNDYPAPYSCAMNDFGYRYMSYPGPQNKPLQTLPVTDTAAYFRILLVFVEFKDDNGWDPGSPYWPPNSPPRYIDSILSPTKKLTGYPDHCISDYFDVVTRNQADFIGDVYHITLPHSYEYYKTTYGDNGFGRNAANLDVLRTLDTGIVVDWNRYDKWRMEDTSFVRMPDGNIDMIYIQYRRGKPDFFSLSSGGHADLMVNYNTLHQNKKINDGTFYLSSGLYGINGSTEKKLVVLDFFVHEYCHYILGNHRPYSRVSGGEGTEAAMGFERAFSPQDELTLDLANVINVDWSRTTYALGDFVTTGDVLKIPTGFVTSDYFLVCSRKRIAKYDCNTGGDTVRGEFFAPAGGLDIGVYIYHVIDGNNYNAWCDLECADGLWNWDKVGYTTPYWSNTQQLPVLVKSSIGRENDDPARGLYDPAMMFSRDGMSVFYPNEIVALSGSKWFSPGKRHINLGDLGMDRLYTNEQENWCSAEVMGDRYDAWRVGYNSVFSPYSSPNTKSRSSRYSSDTTGIYIYVESDTGNAVRIKTYKNGEGGFTEDQILALTPPSRPMIYRAEWFGGYPKIIWENNPEPDMVRPPNLKRYNIYRAFSGNWEIVPADYYWIGTYDDTTPSDTANYIDYSATASSSAVICYRYYIVAYDKYDTPSEKSDWVFIYKFNNVNSSLGNPQRYSINNNYPNPFNPVTHFKFTIPEIGRTTLRIYNLLGQEVSTLIDEQLQPGIYTAVWNAENFPSGVYYYRLTSGNFTETKKMILLK